MVKFMFKVQARNTSGKAKKKGGDKFEVFIVGPDVCILTPHSSLLTLYPSPLTPHPSPLTPHPSPLTPHPSITPSVPPLPLSPHHYSDDSLPRMQGPVENLQVSDIKDGSYLIQWAPSSSGGRSEGSEAAAGEYWIDATLNSNTVSGFPWGVVI